MNKTKYMIIFVVVVAIVIAFGLPLLIKPQVKEKQINKGLVVGVGESKGKHFSQELANAFKEAEYIKEGKQLMAQGKTEEAVKHFELAVNKDNALHRSMMIKDYLIDAYEKNRNYNNAYKLLSEVVSKFKVAPTDSFRIPEEERLKYLKYASEGEYDSAIKHAEFAMEADSKLPTKRLQLYEDRLNDLKAAKDYILSLKKK